MDVRIDSSIYFSIRTSRCQGLEAREECHFDVSMTVQVGALGHYTTNAVEVILDVLCLVHTRTALPILVKYLLTAINVSQQIFETRKRSDQNTSRALLFQELFH